MAYLAEALAHYIHLTCAPHDFELHPHQICLRRECGHSPNEIAIAPFKNPRSQEILKLNRKDLRVERWRRGLPYLYGRIQK